MTIKIPIRFSPMPSMQKSGCKDSLIFLEKNTCLSYSFTRTYSACKSKSVKFHDKTHQKINEPSITHPDLQLKMGCRIFRCHRCLQISNKLFAQAIHNNQVLHKTQFRGTNYHTTLKHTNIHSLMYVICPKCKSHRLKKKKRVDALVLIHSNKMPS